MSDKIKLAKALQVKAKHNAMRDYHSYIKYTCDNYVELPHSKLLADAINGMLVKRDRMLSGEIPKENQFLMVSMPPRHGKSMTITETLPSYFLARESGSKAVVTAYSINLADDFARANSNKIKEHNLFNVSIEADNQNRMILSNKSVMVKAGILGGITGKGAHLMIIDDPIKTSEEANSETTRNKIWNEWVSSLSTRLEPPAIVILVMTRWHEDDLAGRLLNGEYGDPLPWNVINLPLEAEEQDILGRLPGEPLWPERYGYDFIQVRKQYPRDFNALYQGRPTAAEGNLIKREWINWYQWRKEFIDTLPKLILSVDATFKDSSKADKVAIHVWGKKDANLYFVDRINARMDFVTTVQAIRNMLAKYPRISIKLIEDKANGSAIISVLNREIGGFVPVNPKGSKESRVQSILPWYESGNVYFPQNAPFEFKDMLEEFFSFPNGANDDDVDAMSQALYRLIYALASNKKIPIDNDVNDFKNAVTKWR